VLLRGERLAPLSQWEKIEAFITEKECRAHYLDPFIAPGVFVNRSFYTDSRAKEQNRLCVAAADPRLKAP
jgi:hypothetical protein